MKSRNYSLPEPWAYLKTVFTEEISTTFVNSSRPPQSVRDPTQSLSQRGEERRLSTSKPSVRNKIPNSEATVVLLRSKFQIKKILSLYTLLWAMTFRSQD